MSNFKNLFETLLNQQNETSVKKDSDFSSDNNTNYINMLDQYFQNYFDEDEEKMIIPQQTVPEKSKQIKPLKKDKSEIQPNRETNKINNNHVDSNAVKYLNKPNNQNNFDFIRRSIIYDNDEYILTNNIVMSINDLLEKDHVLVKPVIKLNSIDLIQNLFKNDTKNIVIKELCTDIYYIKYYEKEYIFNYINEKTIENGFKDYYKYTTFKKISSESIENLVSLLHVYGCIEAQPFYIFELSFKILNEKNTYTYLVNDDAFKFISNCSSKEIQKKIIKEFIRKDVEYLLESLLNGQFLKLVITDGTKQITI